MFVIEFQITKKKQGTTDLLLGELVFLARLVIIVIIVVIIAPRRIPPNNVPNMVAIF